MNGLVITVAVVAGVGPLAKSAMYAYGIHRARQEDLPEIMKSICRDRAQPEEEEPKSVP